MFPLQAKDVARDGGNIASARKSAQNALSLVVVIPVAIVVASAAIRAR